jgi:hypothetical protein
LLNISHTEVAEIEDDGDMRQLLHGLAHRLIVSAFKLHRIDPSLRRSRDYRVSSSGASGAGMSFAV